MTKLRRAVKVVEGQATSDGAGVHLKRVIGNQQLDQLDPFLLLDEFRSDDPNDYLAGFPEHPHRGFETVTCMLAGSMEHRDHTGNSGRLVAGSVQWMTAGRGIVHSEMPRQEDGLMWGFQLWVNLPASEKMCEPRYQEFSPEQIPEFTGGDGVRVRVIAGESGGVRGAVTGIFTQPLYLEVTLPAGGRFEQAVPSGHNAFVYAFEGNGEVLEEAGRPGAALGKGQLAVTGEGDAIAVVAGGAGLRLLLLAARPLGEPVERLGPFVMNTRAQLMQAVRDFQDGTLTSPGPVR